MESRSVGALQAALAEFAALDLRIAGANRQGPAKKVRILPICCV
jgi:hypothetical protein